MEERHSIEPRGVDTSLTSMNSRQDPYSVGNDESRKPMFNNVPHRGNINESERVKLCMETENVHEIRKETELTHDDREPREKLPVADVVVKEEIDQNHERMMADCIEGVHLKIESVKMENESHSHSDVAAQPGLEDRIEPRQEREHTQGMAGVIQDIQVFREEESVKEKQVRQRHVSDSTPRMQHVKQDVDDTVPGIPQELVVLPEVKRETMAVAVKQEVVATKFDLQPEKMTTVADLKQKTEMPCVKQEEVVGNVVKLERPTIPGIKQETLLTAGVEQNMPTILAMNQKLTTVDGVELERVSMSSDVKREEQNKKMSTVKQEKVVRRLVVKLERIEIPGMKQKREVIMPDVKQEKVAVMPDVQPGNSLRMFEENMVRIPDIKQEKVAAESDVKEEISAKVHGTEVETEVKRELEYECNRFQTRKEKYAQFTTEGIKEEVDSDKKQGQEKNLDIGIRHRYSKKRNVEEELVETRAGVKRKSPETIRKGKNRQKSKKIHKCEDCGKIFYRAYNLKIHRQLHSEERAFTCEECGKTFRQSTVLAQHRRIHTGKRFKCEECGKCFPFFWCLTKHLQRRLNKTGKCYECEVCGKAFGQLANLTIHHRTHSGEKPFPCKVCAKPFADLGSRAKHQRTHTGEKPFQCETCGKAFLDKRSLVRHQRTHTGEKPFKCEDCGKAFAHSSTFVRHQRIHTGEKPFQCENCGKAFVDSGALLKHRRTHTGEKPFKCEQCTKTFTDLSTLIVHKRIHTGEKPFQCENCGKAFIDSSSLHKHRRTHKGR